MTHYLVRNASSWRQTYANFEPATVLGAEEPPPPDEGGGGGVSANYIPAQAGAVLPISTALPATGRKWYIAADGSNGADGSLGSPRQTLGSVLNDPAMAAGDTIVVRGSSTPYPIWLNYASVTKRVTITAMPGEIPVFDGSTPLTGGVAEGSLVKFTYTPMPAQVGDGISLTQEDAFPPATWDASGNPTGFAAERGWVGVTGGSTYYVPSSQKKSALTSGTGRTITGMYPDQVWVNGTQLKQVHDKGLVKQGFFWLARSQATDLNPPSTSLYLHSTDAAASNLRVSKSTGNFIHVNADGVTIRGLKIVNHSPSMVLFAIATGTGIEDLTIEDVWIDSCASISIKLFGDRNGATFDESRVVKRPTLRRVTITRAGWMGVSAMYTDDALFTRCKFDTINAHLEVDSTPKSGAIKATKGQRTKIEHCIFTNIYDAHGVWLDQSNYNCVFASNYMYNIGASSLFFEVSHGVKVVNNLFVKGGDSGINFRTAGSSGIWLVNNTIVGGANTVFIMAEVRGQMVNGRWLSEHVERYGGGGYDTDSPSGSGSDLDKARPGAYAPSGKTNKTPGMNWRAQAVCIVNNVLGHASPEKTSGDPYVALLLRAKTGKDYINVPAVEVVPQSPALLNGNIYQSKYSLVAAVGTQPNQPGNIQPMASVADWRGPQGLGQYYYGLGAAESASKDGPGWVTVSTGMPSPQLEAVQGRAAAPPVDAEINAYVSAQSRNFGSLVAPPGGWK